MLDQGQRAELFSAIIRALGIPLNANPLCFYHTPGRFRSIMQG
jgi:hypothetical protein